MRLHQVPLQVRALAEHSRTEVAEKISLAFVDQKLVPLQRGSRVDDSFANAALHSLLVVLAFAIDDLVFARWFRGLVLDRAGHRLEVNFSVPHQLRLLAEGFFAEIARPAPLLLVNCDDVPVEAGFLAEGFVAEVAGVPAYFLVDHLDVRAEIHEYFVAVFTLLGSLHAVSPHVRVEVAASQEVRFADIALEGISSFVVNSLVLDQIDLCFVVFRALVAQPWSLGAVVRQVILEVADVLKIKLKFKFQLLGFELNNLLVKDL